MKEQKVMNSEPKMLTALPEEKSNRPVQCKSYTARTDYPQPPIQRKPNNTGLPQQLKTGVENLSGYSMDDVQVHYNSAKPEAIGALAYAQGTDIHVAAGQEKHLPHEAWHVVQQKQGRVAATRQLKAGVAVNDNKGLEREADVMGQRAMQSSKNQPADTAFLAGQASGEVVQRAVGFEFETGYKIEKLQGFKWVNLQKMDVIKSFPNGVKLTADENSGGFSAIEIVLDPPIQESNPAGMVKALNTFKKISAGLDRVRAPHGINDLADIPSTNLSQVKDVRGSIFYRVTPNFSGFRGNGQLTGGFRFDKIISFLEETTSNNPDPNHAHATAISNVTRSKGVANDVQSIQDAKTQVNNIGGSDELKGLVALLAMYLRSASSTGIGTPMFNYAKLISNSFMARTDFGAMFKKLPDADYNRFIKNPASFITLVLTAANMAGSGNTKVFERGVRKNDQRSHADYNVDVTTQIPDLGISRHDWLLQITLGIDKISSSAMPQLSHILMGLGALGSRTDRVGNDPAPANGAKDKGRGIIMELRNMYLDKTAPEFATIVQDIFNYILATNA